MKKRFMYALCAVVILAACGCSAETANSSAEITSSAEAQASDEAQEASQEVFAMDTYMTVTAYGSGAEEAVEKAVGEIKRLDTLLTSADEIGEVAKINANAGGQISEDTAYLLERSLALYESTGGAFDVAIYPIMQAWGFIDKNFKVPSGSELEKLLEITNANDIVYDETTSEVSFKKDGMMIDFGGIAKGYISSRIMDIFQECGVESGMVNLGGNAQVKGTKTDGSKWRIAIQSPDDEGDEYGMIGVIEVEDKAVITSGGYERYFKEDGVTYHHIIDPATGKPANNGLISVTIVCADGTLADGLSTSLYVMGPDKAKEYWREHSDEFDMVLETDDHKLLVSEGLADSFSSELEIEIVSKGE